MASLIPGYEYDIFISYRQKDNKYDGWVTEFVDNLKHELESMFKDEVSVYFDINPSDYLLESYDVDALLKVKLKCLIFIPIISRTYCDPKSFAWDNELKAFVDKASVDLFGFKVKISSGNVANRVLPIRIHDLDVTDNKLFESVVGGVMRSIDFVYKETGANRQLRAKDDDIIKSPNQILYRDQINKVALTIRDIIESMKASISSGEAKPSEIQLKKSEKKMEIKVEEPVREEIINPKQGVQVDKTKQRKERRFSLSRNPRILIPSILITISILGALFFILNRHFKVKWAKEKALPDIEQLRNEFNFKAAFNLVQKAEKYISKEQKFKELALFVTGRLTVLTDPPGADVYVKEYSDPNSEWKSLGKTPIDSRKMPGYTFYLMRLEKTGYENIIAVANSGTDTLSRKLFKEGTIPKGMVYVDGYFDWVKNTLLKDSCGFFIDRFEVTNKQYKEFVNNGGYRKQEYWKNEFIKNGKKLTLEKALAEFVDKTGRPGPSTWEAGDYPDGQDDYPVTGVSWYEAAAYADYAGKSLPTSDHWQSAAGLYLSSISETFAPKLFPLSNFKGKGPEPVGKNQGINYFGAYDMAGNVREWGWNETKFGRIILGGGWDDATYEYGANQLPSFDRSPENGLRCVKYIDKKKIPLSAFRFNDLSDGRDFSKEKPLADNIFAIYKNQFLYDKTDLKAVVEDKDESLGNWIIEKISFTAAYGNERMIIYLYLPKNASPPYQTLIFYPGSYGVWEKDVKKSIVPNWYFDYILKSGRAVVYPVYKGTYERNDGLTIDMHMPNQSHQYTEWLIKWVKDFSRTIDYLETRPDIDTKRLGFYGHSWGGIIGGIIPAVENRLAVNILILGGFSIWDYGLPEADAINYVSRVKIPTLMLNGKYDYRFPLGRDLMPFFNLLGTPEKDKRLCVYETEHYVTKSDMIREVLSWLDKYLGPVK